jgi:putative addiction module component (TIGR02574 family)
MSTAAKIIQEAEALPKEQQAKVVDCLLQNLHEPEPSLDAKWAARAKRRLAELRDGTATPVPGEQVFARIRERYEQ